MILATLLLGAAHAGASITHVAFDDPATVELNGTAVLATTDDGDVLRLTPPQGDAAAAAYHHEAIDFVDFSAYFRFRITEAGGAISDCNDTQGGDGLAFVLSTGPSILSHDGMGIRGLPESVAVAFDTWCDEADGDPDASHVGIHLGGDLVHGDDPAPTGSITPLLDNGEAWHAWVDHDGTTLAVRVSADGVRPELPVAVREVDLRDAMGRGSGNVGFAAGTSGSWAAHDVWFFEYRTPFEPYGDAGIADPVSCGCGNPGAGAPWGVALGALLIRRRRGG